MVKSVRAGAIYSSTGTRAEDSRNLGNHSGCHDVALENLGVTCKCVDAFLDSCTSGVVQTDAGSPHFHCQIHHLANLESHGLGKRSAEDREILGENVDKASVDRAEAGDNAVAEDMLFFLSEVCAAMSDKHVKFFKAALVEELRNTLAGRVFTFGVLLVDRFLTTPRRASALLSMSSWIFACCVLIFIC